MYVTNTAKPSRVAGNPSEAHELSNSDRADGPNAEASASAPLPGAIVGMAQSSEQGFTGRTPGRASNFRLNQMQRMSDFAACQTAEQSMG